MLYIDSHIHFWEIGRFSYKFPEPDTSLYRNFLPIDLEEEMKKTPIKNAVFVQVMNDCLGEAEWISCLARSFPFIKGIVAGIDLTSPNVEAQLCSLSENPLVVGVRHILDYEDDNWLLCSDLEKGFRLLHKFKLTFDLLLRPRLLPVALQLAKKFPKVKMVVDHIAKPNIKTGEIAQWQEGLEHLASLPNIFCKISGLVTEAAESWTETELCPYVKKALSLFGAERCMFGSDWPVCTSANASYQKVFEIATNCTAELSPGDKELLFGKTAATFYNLQNLNL